MRSARVAVPLMVAAAAIAGACTDVGTNPNLAVSIEFDTLPFPAVVTGDTLRDSIGRAAPLRALAFNASGALIAHVPIQYIMLDTGVTIDSAGFVTAQARSGRVRIVATVNGVQSIAESLLVARRPDTMVAPQGLSDTVRYTIPDTAAQNVSAPLVVRLLTADTAGGDSVTRGWVVSYQASFHGQTLSQADTSFAYFLNGVNRSAVDTTKADGTTRRTLRVKSTLLTGADSVIVFATARYRGVPVRGAPMRIVVQLRLKPRP